jgi:catechol 2,3-dioxygenase-like lactoylglutathione lyase family enzyme
MSGSLSVQRLGAVERDQTDGADLDDDVFVSHWGTLQTRERPILSARPLLPDSTGFEKAVSAFMAKRGKFDVGGVLLDQPFKIRRLGHFGLNVSDPAACLAFYCDGLGFRISDPLDIAEGHPKRDELKALGDTRMYFLRHGTDHHSIVLANGVTYNAAGRGGDVPADVTVNQMTWQVGSLAEVSNAIDWFDSKGVRISRAGLDMPGSNWHCCPYDPEGHRNELYYGIEQIGWTGLPPRAMHERGYRDARRCRRFLSTRRSREARPRSRLELGLPRS